MNDTSLSITASRQFPEWLQEQGLSLALTTYQAGKLFLIGAEPEGKLSIFERTFNRCLGLWADGQTIWLSSLFQLWRLENVLESGHVADGYDRLYVPQTSNVTGDLDIHDLGIEDDGRLVFVNTLFGCLATTSESHSFVPIWKPRFIDRLAAEDRCHLNGLAMADGRARYVTAVSRSNVADGWRDHRQAGGVVIDVQSDEVIADGLSMPHSPRVYRDRLWLLNSGTGHFGFIDDSGRFEALAFCPGYLRGLAFAGDFAIMGMSMPREGSTFSDLSLDANLAKAGAAPRCGLVVVDLRTGDTVHWIRFEGIVTELYDVAVLPGVRKPKAIGLKTDEIRRILRVDEWGSL